MSIITERIVNQGHGPLTASYVCVHSTSNPGATAANHAQYWSGAGADMAVHLVSDWTECLHTVPYDRLCWQVGNGNAYVEGIEICEATNQADFDRGIQIAAQAVRERLAAHGWGVDRLICHDTARQWWGGTDHTDPVGYLARWGWTWDDFVRLVANQSTPSTKEDNMMQCIIQPNDESRLVYFDGQQIHKLTHPDQVTALQQVAQQCGYTLPIFKLGSKSAPWFTRLEQAVK